MNDHLVKFTEKTPVLDQGFVRLVDVMGDDGSVVEAARVTTGKGRSVHQWREETDARGRRQCSVCQRFELLPGRLTMDLGDEYNREVRSANIREGVERVAVCLEGDRRILRYMLRHAHWSPFEFAEMAIHLRLPMDVWRQLVRHWSLSVQEYSTRYSPAVDAIAATAPDAWRAKGGKNRQGSSGLVTEWPEYAPLEWARTSDGRPVKFDVRHLGYSESASRAVTLEMGLSGGAGKYLSAREQQLHALAREVYEERLAFGVAPEQARKDLPLSNYTDVYLKGNLRDWLNMLAQRLDGHAQYEIRQYAQAIAAIVKEWCPLTWAAFEDWRLNAHVLSAQQVELVRFLLADTFETAKELAASEGRALDVDVWAKSLLAEYKVPSTEAAEFLAAFQLSQRS